MGKSGKNGVGRRGFLKSAAVGAATGTLGFVDAPAAALAQEPDARSGAEPLSAENAARENGGARPQASARVIEHPGSDFMCDVFKSLGLEYLGSNPGSTFESLHESLINYGKNTMPEFLTCCHEESAVAMAHGYYKVEGKPMMALLHGDIGIMHASMAIYNAYADRVPIFMVAGNHADLVERGQGVESLHSGLDLGALVRDYTKWDDQPYSLGHFAQSAVRAYKIAMTPPMAPVLIVANNEIQAHPNNEKNLVIPRLVMTEPPAGNMSAVAEAAKMLVDAERPMIIPERYARTPKAIGLLVELAETLQAPVNNRERLNFPSRHRLAGKGGAGYTPDVVLCLEVNDLQNDTRAAHRNKGKIISITALSLEHKSNLQDFGHYAEVDLDIGADAEATMPYLIEAVKKLITADRKRAYDERGAKLAAAHQRSRERDVQLAAVGWDASPVSVARIAAELWPLIEKEDWSLVSPQGFIANWPSRLWDMKKSYNHIGGRGAEGMGYGLSASVGGALANKKYGRLSINIQTDGDFNYAPGVLWTAAHHRIPLLTIMHNNRGYHQEVMFVEQQASLHNRGAERCHIGTKLWDPNIDYASIAKGYGMYAEGPIADPRDLQAAFKRGIERVKKGEPALIDVVTQPRG